MMKLMQAMLLALVAAHPALAADTPPSDASVRELMTVSESRKLLDGGLERLDSAMQQEIQRSLDGKPVTPDQQKILDDMRTKLVAMLKAEMAWDKMEPSFIAIYKKTFTQSEIDGILTFYKSDAGKALIAKMPTIMQASMQLMQERMGAVIPKMQQLEQETLEKLNAAPSAH